VNVAISDEAANTTTVPDKLAEAAAALLAGAGAALLDVPAATDDGAALGLADAGAETAGVGAADDVAGAAFFEELHAVRPKATTTVVTRTADAWRFIDSPKCAWGRRLLGVRY
jgi:hypothetical protein